MVNGIKKIGIITGGGDCPGLNAVIRAVVKTAVNDFDIEVIGLKDGFEGLMKKATHKLGYKDASGILSLGGTILGTSNVANPFRYPSKENGEIVYTDQSDLALQNCQEMELDALICVGGDGTLRIAHQLYQKGLPVIGVPKTIDNDLSATDVTFGFDSAITTATEAIDKLHSTAQSHHRVMIIELMGRYAGWITLEAGMAGGADVILLPEIPYKIDKVCELVAGRNKKGKRFSIIAIAEGARAKGGKLSVSKVVEESTDPIRLGGIGHQLASQIEEQTGLECRVTVLGHLQRGGSPTAFDRILGTRFGHHAVQLVAKGRFGQMVSLQGLKIINVSLKKAIDTRLVPKNCDLIKTAKAVGVSFGV